MAASSNIIQFQQPPHSTGASLSDLFFLDLLEKHINPSIDLTLSCILQELLQCSDNAISNNEASHFYEAHSLLKQSLTRIKENYISELKKPQEIEVQKPEPDLSPLSLVDNSEFERKLIAQVSAQALIVDESAQLLINITSRIHDRKDALYPITPENICTSFSEAISSLSIPIDIEEKMLAIFSHTMKSSALAMWQEADELLESEGFQIPKSKDSKINYEPVKQNTQNGDSESILLETITNNVLNKVENLINNNSQTITNNQQATTNSIDSSDLATELSSIQIQLLERLSSIEDLAETIKEALDSQGISQQLSKQHQDLINMVGMLFEYILDDHELHSEIRKLISLLQIPVLKLALLDEEFLSNRHHPARDLLNEMTTTGMKCSENTSIDDPLICLIEETVRYLISESADAPNAFPIALNDFRIKLTEITSIDQKQTDNTEKIFHQDNNSPLLYDKEAADDESSYPQEISDNEPNQDEPIEEIILQSDSYLDHHFFSQFDHGKNSSSKYFQPIEGLNTGQWVEFIGASSKRMRCKLSHIDEMHDRYIFVNRSGMKIAEKRGSVLKDEINQGTLKILDQSPLFDRALQAVMDKILRF